MNDEDNVQPEEVVPTDPVEAVPDALEAFSDIYVIESEEENSEGLLTVTINVDGYRVAVSNGAATSREEVLETCARTAKEVRKNKPKK